MKKLFVCMLAVMTAIAGMAQPGEKYMAAMRKNISEIDSAMIKNDPARLQELANAFERIGDAEKTQWLPYYYAAYTQLMSSFFKNEPANNDPIADKADAFIAKADAIEKNNSELSLLKAMSASVHMLVNPMQRWMEYGQKIQQYSTEAVAQDPKNPRPHWFNGVSLKNTPEQFGGGCAAAKPHLTKAVELNNEFKPASDLHPNWGSQVFAKDLADCNK